MEEQMTIFDFEQNQKRCGTCDCYCKVWNQGYYSCFSNKSPNAGKIAIDEHSSCEYWEPIQEETE